MVHNFRFGGLLSYIVRFHATSAGAAVEVDAKQNEKHSNDQTLPQIV